MSDTRPRLSYFANAPGQQHVQPQDHYLYARRKPSHSVVVIGTGTIGMEHMRVATRLGRVRIHGVFDTAEHSMDIALEQFATLSDASVIRYPSLEAACEDAAVDAFLICTPNYTHLEVLEVVARTGKPVLLEKPMATTLADARRVCEIATDYPSFIQLGLQYRYKAAYVEARHEVLERQSLGPVHMLSMSEYRPPFLDKVGQWNKFNSMSGGTLVEKCCHYFDLMTLFAQSEPSKVYASAGRAVNFIDLEHDGQASDIDDHAFVIVDYASGLRGQFTLNMFAPHFHEELIITGQTGRLTATERFNFHLQDSAEAIVRIDRHDQHASRLIDVAYSREIERSGHHGATWFEHVAFADQLAGQACDAATPRQGLWSMLIACAAQQSAATGAPVHIADLIQQHQLGDFLAD